LPEHEAIVPEAHERTSEFVFDEPAEQSQRDKQM
jgi:hypothetical protein